MAGDVVEKRGRGSTDLIGKQSPHCLIYDHLIIYKQHGDLILDKPGGNREMGARC